MAPAGLHFEAFFDLVPTGAALYAPLYDEQDELVDFRFVRLNPAGQRLLGLPAQPPRTFREYYPNSVPTGIFDQYRTAYLTGRATTYDVSYAGDDLDTFFRLVAQRSGDLLVVNFTDMADLPRAGAEQALRDSRAREQAARAEAERQRGELQAVFAQAPMAMALLRGPEFLVEWANPRMEQIWGRPLAQLLGRPHFQALPDLAGQGFEQVFAAVFEAGQSYDMQELLVHIEQAHPSHQGYFNITYQPVYEGPRITGILASALEVTDQVLARLRVQQLNEELETRVQERTRETLALQAELLAAAQRQVQAREAFYQVFEQNPAAVSLLRGPTHRFEYVNPVYQQVFAGRPLVGHDFAEALPEAAAQGYLTLLEGVYLTGETFFGAEVPFVFEQPDTPPRTIYFNFTYQAYRENDEIVGVSTFALDVTEQVLARQEREARQGELQRIFEQAPVAIGLYAGEDLRVTAVNARMAALFGRPATQLLGRPLLDAMPELRGQGFDDLMRQVRATRVPYVGREMPVTLTRDGEISVTYYNFVYQPIYDAAGQVLGIMDATTEVTEQVLARQQVQVLNEELAVINKELAAINEKLTAKNEELNESNTRLTRTNVDLDTFVYTASHDLKAPITNIESITLALRDTLPAEVQQDELVAHLLDLLDQTVTRFQFTIAQLTDISRLQLAHAGPAESVDVAAVIESVRLDLVPALATAGTHFHTEVPPGLVVSFSPANLRSIVYNLLSNAVKYCAPNRPSRVRVHAERTAAGVVLAVEDNGLGMSEMQQRQLFGLFQRLHTHVEGTGVGLYITKRLVENAGGAIAVHSQLDAGSTFTVTLPA